MVTATQSYLAGRWQMVRIIENVDEGVIGEVWGQAAFRAARAGLGCHETGVLRFGGVDWHTERASLWVFEGDRIEVRYEDGRPFHAFLRDAPLALSVERDVRYRVDYEFWTSHWLSTWEMTAPRGTYRMSTRYWR